MTDLSLLSLDALHDLKRKVAPDGPYAARIEARLQELAPALSEKQVQAAIVKRLGKLGVAVYSLSQPRATKQTAGLPDILAICPYRGIFVVEVKAAGGKQRPEQRVFQERWERAGGRYVLGGLAEVEEFLRNDTPSPHDEP